MSEDVRRQFVRALVAEALEGYEDQPPELLARIRDQLEDYFLFTPEGRRLVRQAQPDPSVQSSADVQKADAAGVESDKKTRAR